MQWGKDFKKMKGQQHPWAAEGFVIAALSKDAKCKILGMSKSKTFTGNKMNGYQKVFFTEWVVKFLGCENSQVNIMISFSTTFSLAGSQKVMFIW